MLDFDTAFRSFEISALLFSFFLSLLLLTRILEEFFIILVKSSLEIPPCSNSVHPYDGSHILVARLALTNRHSTIFREMITRDVQSYRLSLLSRKINRRPFDVHLRDEIICNAARQLDEVSACENCGNQRRSYNGNSVNCLHRWRDYTRAW